MTALTGIPCSALPERRPVSTLQRMSREFVAALARCLLVAIGGMLFTSCGGGNGPTMVAAVPTPPPLNLTGTWKGTLVENCPHTGRTFDATMALAQPAGSTTLTGTVTTQYLTSTFVDTITAGSLIDRSVEFETVAHDINGIPYGYLYRGEVDASGTAISGTIAIIGSGSCVTFSVRR